MKRRNSVEFILTIGGVLLIGLIATAAYTYTRHSTNQMIRVEGTRFTTLDPVTGKVLDVEVKTFLLDKDLVTVAEFDEFVKATGYVTEADKFGDAGVFDAGLKSWRMQAGANYLYPFGKDKPRANAEHPVTQVSWNDARAYAAWKGKRLPSQWEWELAARNGSAGEQQYAWGSDLVVAGKYKANTWQGSFPYRNTLDDGFEFTSPVGAFGETAAGFTDMGGNVWQWCTDDIAPTERERAMDPGMRKVLRGGSFLCDPLVCHGYQVQGRAASTPESSMAHIGFRCAAMAE